MRVEGGISVAVGNLDIVSVDAAVAHLGDDARLGRADRRAAGGGDVGAGVVAPLAGDGVIAPVEGGGDVGAPGQGPVPLAVLGRQGGQLLLVLFLRRGKLLVKALVLLLQACERALILPLGALDLLDEPGNLRLLDLQLGPVGLLLRLELLLGAQVRLQLGFRLRQLIAGRGEGLNDAVVIVHHLGDHHGIVQQLGKGGGGEQDGQVGHAARLLHVPHLAAEEGVLVGLLLL